MYRKENAMPQTVTIPVSVLKKLQSATKAAVEAQDALEDYLLSVDEPFLTRMRTARASHRGRRTKPLAFLKKP
jgi:hypothetical protein